MNDAKSIILEAYLKAEKARNKAHNRLWQYCNSPKAVRERSEMYRMLVSNPKKKECWQAWAEFLRNRRDVMTQLRNEWKQHAKIAHSLNAVLKFYRSGKL